MTDERTPNNNDFTSEETPRYGESLGGYGGDDTYRPTSLSSPAEETPKEETPIEVSEEQTASQPKAEETAEEQILSPEEKAEQTPKAEKEPSFAEESQTQEDSAESKAEQSKEEQYFAPDGTPVKKSDAPRSEQTERDGSASFGQAGNGSPERPFFAPDGTPVKKSDAPRSEQTERDGSASFGQTGNGSPERPFFAPDGTPQNPNGDRQSQEGGEGFKGYTQENKTPLSQKADAFSILSLTCAILSLVICCCGGWAGIVLSVCAVVFAFVSKSRSENKEFGTMAKSALIIAVVGILFGIFAASLGFFGNIPGNIPGDYTDIIDIGNL